MMSEINKKYQKKLKEFANVGKKKGLNIMKAFAVDQWLRV